MAALKATELANFGKYLTLAGKFNALLIIVRLVRGAAATSAISSACFSYLANVCVCAA